MKTILIKWLDKLIYGWADTMPDTRQEDVAAWDSMQEELKELKELRVWVNKIDVNDIKDHDVATVEILHDMVLHRDHNREHIALVDARELITKLYKIVEAEY